MKIYREKCARSLNTLMQIRWMCDEYIDILTKLQKLDEDIIADDLRYLQDMDIEIAKVLARLTEEKEA